MTTDVEGTLLSLQRATHATLAVLAQRLSRLSLTSSEMNVLAILADGRSRTVSEIGKAAGSHPSTLTGVLDRLARRGHLERSPHAEDRRALTISLTQQGEGVAAAVSQAFAEVERAALGGRPAAEVQILRTGLDALTSQNSAPSRRRSAPGPSDFDGLFAQVTAGRSRFGHREHVHLCWLAVRALGESAAAALIAAGLEGVASTAGAPRKFHVTRTRAWTCLVAARVARPDSPDTFEDFAERNQDLLDKHLLNRHYRASTLDSDRARTAWVEPDLAPLDQDARRPDAAR